MGNVAWIPIQLQLCIYFKEVLGFSHVSVNRQRMLASFICICLLCSFLVSVRFLSYIFWGLAVGFRLLQYSVVCTVGFLSLFYLLFIFLFICTRR